MHRVWTHTRNVHRQEEEMGHFVPALRSVLSC